MPSRPDIRDLATNVRAAFADHDKDALLDVLTFVVKEYVVEGPPPMLIHQAETLADLANASFAQLITAMQTRFDHAELAMFVVDGDQVSVRVGGVMQPLLASRQSPGAAIATPSTDLPRPAAGVRVVETTLQQRPPAAAPSAPAPVSAAAAPASAPPPVRGISLRGRPSDGGGGGQPAAPPSGSLASSGSSGSGSPPSTPPAGAAPPTAPAQPAPPEKSEHGGDDASARFSLLELD